MRWAYLQTMMKEPAEDGALTRRLNSMQEQSQKKLNIARVPIKRIVTSSEPNRQNSGEQADTSVKRRAIARKKERSSPQGQALLTLPDQTCEVGSNKVGPGRRIRNQRWQLELARPKEASQSPSSLRRRRRCFRREIMLRKGFFSGVVPLRRASP